MTQLVSYWHRTSPEIHLSNDVPPTATIGVIGGGITGVALCYFLAKLGVKPLLLEQEMLASGATGRNGGFVSLGPARGYLDAVEHLGHKQAEQILRFTQENRGLLLRLIEEEKIACGYHEPGSIHLILDEMQWRDLTREADALRANQIAAAMLDRSEVQSLVATPLARAALGGRFFPDTVLHPVLLVQALMQAAQRLGAHFCRCTAWRLAIQGRHLSLKTTHGTIAMERLVIATNAGISTLLPSLPITPVRGQMLSYAPLPPIFSAGMSSSLTNSGEYWHQRSDGAILLGGCRAVAPHADVGIQENRPTFEVQHALEEVLPRFFPKLESLRVQYRWGGLMAFTPDLLPLADQLPDQPVWAVGGFSGHGMPFVLRLAQLIANELVTGEHHPDLRPFRFQRFPTLHQEKRFFKRNTFPS